jgi:pre-mRNA-splicing factor ISY1
MKDKKRWEDRIRELGGPDYRQTSQALESDGLVLPGGNEDGYKYFGAAKNLPKVRELL